MLPPTATPRAWPTCRVSWLTDDAPPAFSGGTAVMMASVLAGTKVLKPRAMRAKPMNSTK